MSRGVKIAGFAILFLVMLATTIWAGMQQNLLTEFSWTNSPMWFQATLIDFYINQFILWLWVLYLEPKWWVRLLWLVLFMTLGSMGTSLFIIYRLITKKSLFDRGIA
jgi:Protein of unknown function (DUF1475)